MDKFGQNSIRLRGFVPVGPTTGTVLGSLRSHIPLSDPAVHVSVADTANRPVSRPPLPVMVCDSYPEDMDDVDTVRRGLIAAVIGGVAAGGVFSPAATYLDQFAPLSGDVWNATTDQPPSDVDSPHGRATLQYDGRRVPEVSADEEAALYYAVGYAHGTDRLFQMDLQRRLMRGQLSAVVGDAALDSDEFHVRMDFARAAAANWKIGRASCRERG